LSVNLDPEAVKKIQGNGLDAVLCRAEELEANSGIKSDIFLSFEMLEHLFDPISFLREMSKVNGNPIFAITVPYMKKSRVGLHYIRKNLPGTWNPENTHIFELCPYDWELLFNFAGWEVIYDESYLQFPMLPNPFFFTKPVWTRMDFEGFQGFILRKNSKYKESYIG
jgi:2-polyprenyl-3-methyl-5-hydroxy-6-metoxy-1,4-benzoquinol methylase